MMPIEIGPADLAGFYRAASGLPDIDIIIRGCEQLAGGGSPPNEERESVLAALAATQTFPVWQMRTSDSDLDGQRGGKDHFAIIQPEGSVQLPLWHELTTWLTQHAGGKHLLLDMTSLSGSCLFQLHRAAAEAGSIRLSYLYTSPERYPQVDTPDEIPPVVTRSIKQPYGYRSFAQEHLPGRRRKHVIVLGFDRHRPNKFIEHYQWPLQQVHVLLGSPAYVEGGTEQAMLSLGSVFEDIKRLGHVHEVDPKRLWSDDVGAGVVDVLKSLDSDGSSLDIVPLGPKPTLLGCIVYWHGLSVEQQEETRFLYDFPVSRQIRTSGIGVSWLYPNVINPER